MQKPDDVYIAGIVKTALNEDIGSGDITTFLTDCYGLNGYGEFVAKDDGVMAGFFVAEAVFKALSPDFKITANIEEGKEFKKGDILGSIEGDFGLMLSGERTALNFLQRTCAIASATRNAVLMISHTKAKILDTRKTVPGLRLLDKYAVKKGGGENHRTGLYDMILIKNNHISAQEGIEKAIRNAIDRKSADVKIEVEARNFKELETALSFELDRILLDNFTPSDIREAVKIRDQKGKTVDFEASGGINLTNLVEYAETDVEYISLGCLTHSVKAKDISLWIKRQ